MMTYEGSNDNFKLQGRKVLTEPTIGELSDPLLPQGDKLVLAKPQWDKL